MTHEANTWHAPTLRQLRDLLLPDGDVLALAVFGSSITPGRDRWSDLDLLLVVAERATPRFHPALDWLQPLGTIFAFDQSATAYSSVTRVCFSDFRRLDCVIVTAAGLAQPGAVNVLPLWAGVEVVFARSPALAPLLARPFAPPQPSPFTAAQFAGFANGFWFKAALAVSKVVRGDLLIALHLALDLVRDCCVLAMVLRDRAEGTNHHRHGGSGNQVVARLDTLREPYTHDGILRSIAHSAEVFDALAAEWSTDVRPQREPVLAAVTAARGALAGGPPETV